MVSSRSCVGLRPAIDVAAHAPASWRSDGRYEPERGTCSCYESERGKCVCHGSTATCRPCVFVVVHSDYEGSASMEWLLNPALPLPRHLSMSPPSSVDLPLLLITPPNIAHCLGAWRAEGEWSLLFLSRLYLVSSHPRC